MEILKRVPSSKVGVTGEGLVFCKGTMLAIQ